MDRQRIDKWLWHAREVRTRTSAAALVTAGQVNSILIERINSAPVLGPQLPATVATALTDAGFARTPRGLRLR